MIKQDLHKEWIFVHPQGAQFTCLRSQKQDLDGDKFK